MKRFSLDKVEPRFQRASMPAQGGRKPGLFDGIFACVQVFLIFSMVRLVMLVTGLKFVRIPLWDPMLYSVVGYINIGVKEVQELIRSF